MNDKNEVKDRGEHEGSDNLVCFNHIIDLHDNHDEEAWLRILDKFIEAVEAEGGCAAGGMHPAGDNPLCGCCGPSKLCFECGKELEDDVEK